MSRTRANYTIIIEKEKRIGTNDICYTAFVPRLGIATEADTIEEAEKEVHSLIQFHIDTLALEGEDIPVEATPSFVTKTEVFIPENATLST